jgi:hypothetical protein
MKHFIIATAAILSINSLSAMEKNTKPLKELVDNKDTKNTVLLKKEEIAEDIFPTAMPTQGLYNYYLGINVPYQLSYKVLVLEELQKIQNSNNKK